MLSDRQDGAHLPERRDVGAADAYGAVLPVLRLHAETKKHPGNLRNGSGAFFVAERDSAFVLLPDIG